MTLTHYAPGSNPKLLTFMNILSSRNFKKQKFHVRKVKCVVRATEREMSFRSMEMSANRK